MEDQNGRTAGAKQKARKEEAEALFDVIKAANDRIWELSPAGADEGQHTFRRVEEAIAGAMRARREFRNVEEQVALTEIPTYSDALDLIHQFKDSYPLLWAVEVAALASRKAQAALKASGAKN